MSMRLILVAIVCANILNADAPSVIGGPAKISLTFQYAGKDHTKTYFTMIRKIKYAFPFSGYGWLLGKDRTLVSLPDGSVVVISLEWPPLSQDPGTGTTKNGSARWLWIDNPGLPGQITYGDSVRRYSPISSKVPGYTTLDVKYTVERAGSEFLSDAIRSDAAHDETDILRLSNQMGVSDVKSGSLFAGLRLTPITASDAESNNEVETLKASAGWLSVADDCRVKPLARPFSPARLTIYTQGTGLLRHGDLWTTKGGPGSSEPSVMYATGAQYKSSPGQGFSVSPSREPAMKMIHNVEWNGALCSAIEPPVGTTNEVLEFSNGGLALLSPSDEIVVLKPAAD